MKLAISENSIWNAIATVKGVSIERAKELVYSEASGKKIEANSDTTDKVYSYMLDVDEVTSEEMIYEETMNEETMVKRISDMISTSTPEDLAKVATLLLGKQVVVKDSDFMVARFEPVVWECLENKVLKTALDGCKEWYNAEVSKNTKLENVNATLQDTIKKMVEDNTKRDVELGDNKTAILEALEKCAVDIASPEAMAELDYAKGIIGNLK